MKTFILFISTFLFLFTSTRSFNCIASENTEIEENTEVNVHPPPPKKMSKFAKILWNMMLAKDPNRVGAEDLTNLINSADNIFGYGIGIVALRELTEDPYFLQLAQEGSDYRAEYWLALIDKVVNSSQSKYDWELNPFPRLIQSLNDFIVHNGISGIRPISLYQAERQTQLELQEKYSIEDESWADWLNVSKNLREFVALSHKKLDFSEVPGGVHLDFERWKEQQKAWIDELNIENYRYCLKVLIKDYGLKVDLHKIGSTSNLDYNALADGPVHNLTVDDVKQLEIRISRADEKPEMDAIDGYGKVKRHTTMEARLSSLSDKYYDITIENPIKFTYIYDTYYLEKNHGRFLPLHPQGLADLMRSKSPTRTFKYDVNLSSFGFTSDLFVALEDLSKSIDEVSIGTHDVLLARIKAAEKKYRLSILDTTPIKLRARLDNDIPFDKWYDSKPLIDFFWYGYKQSQGLRFWRDRDRKASLTNLPYIKGEDLYQYLPAKSLLRMNNLWFWLKSKFKSFLKLFTMILTKNGRSDLYAINQLGKLLEFTAETGNRNVFNDATKMAEQHSITSFNLIQPFPGDPLPAFFEYGNPRTIDRLKTEVINLNNSLTKVDLIMESKRFQLVQSGVLSIPRAVEQDIVRVRVVNVNGIELELNKDFRVERDKVSGNLFVVLLSDHHGELFHTISEYKNRKVLNDITNRSIPLNLDVLQNLTNELRGSGLLDLADELDLQIHSARTRGEKLSLQDLESMFKDSAYYSFTQNNSNQNLTPKGRFGGFVNYLGVNNSLCYFCQPAYNLFSRFLNFYFIESNTDASALPMTGFNRSEAHRLSEVRHVKTAVYFPDGKRLLLDSTPSKLDPRNKNIPAHLINHQNLSQGTVESDDVDKVNVELTSKQIKELKDLNLHNDSCPNENCNAETGDDNDKKTNSDNIPEIIKGHKISKSLKRLGGLLFTSAIAGGTYWYISEYGLELPTPNTNSIDINPISSKPQSSVNAENIWQNIKDHWEYGLLIPLGALAYQSKNWLKNILNHNDNNSQTQTQNTVGVVGNFTINNTNTLEIPIEDEAEIEVEPVKSSSQVSLDKYKKDPYIMELAKYLREQTKFIINTPASLSRIQRNQKGVIEPLKQVVSLTENLARYLEGEADINATRVELQKMFPSQNHNYAGIKELLQFFIDQSYTVVNGLNDCSAALTAGKSSFTLNEYRNPVLRGDIEIVMKNLRDTVKNINQSHLSRHLLVLSRTK